MLTFFLLIEMYLAVTLYTIGLLKKFGIARGSIPETREHKCQYFYFIVHYFSTDHEGYL